MNVIVTSGHTSEPIDRVRILANHSTGELGQKIAHELALRSVRVDYVYGGHRPQKKRGYINQIEIKTFQDLEETLHNLFTTKRIDAIIHAMAVSDYRAIGMVQEGVRVPIPNKISSDNEELTLVFAKNKKLISQFKAWSPKTILVGFKLLVDVSEAELLATAEASMKKNKADLLVANDLCDISPDHHDAFILEKGEVAWLSTKQDIANHLAIRVKALYEGKKHKGVRIDETYLTRG